MSKKVNKETVIRDLAIRVRRNEEGVKSFLDRAGVEHGARVTLQNLQDLQKINPVAFQEMVNFLYPANASADGATLNFVGSLVGSVVGTAGSTLASIFGKTDQSNVIALQQQYAAQQQKMMYVIFGVVAVVGVVIAIVAMRSRGAGVTIAK